jgi:hypothetical protein
MLITKDERCPPTFAVWFDTSSMRAPSIAYAVLLASSLATTSQLTGRQRLHQPCGPCLATDDYLLPTIQAPHAALRVPGAVGCPQGSLCRL